MLVHFLESRSTCIVPVPYYNVFFHVYQNHPTLYTLDCNILSLTHVYIQSLGLPNRTHAVLYLWLLLDTYTL